MRVLPVLVPLLWFNATAWLGIDAGRHWDDPRQLQNLRTAIATETLLPHWYNYPSMCFWLGVAGLLPDALAAAGDAGRDGVPAARDRLLETTRSKEFLLRLRRIFAGVSSLAILWVHLLVLSWRRRPLEAFSAAAIVAGSFEFLYHARWLAPDAVMAQFGALGMLGVVRAEVTGRRSGVVLAVLGAGLACATKYTGGLFLVPALAVAWRHARATGGAPGRALLRSLALFAATFLVVTPGAVLSPWTFVHDVKFEMQHYRWFGHYGYTVTDPREHAALALRYVLLDLPAPFDVAAIALLGLAVLGGVSVLRRRRALGVLLLVVPLAYVPYLTQQVVLFVRNWLVMLPFIAVFAARGAGAVAGRLRWRGARLAWGAALAALLLANGAYLWRSAISIRQRDRARHVQELAGWLAAHPGLEVYLSPQVAAEWRAAGLPTEGVTAAPAAADAAAFYQDETADLNQLPSNVPGRTLAVFGPLDRNFEWYTNWPEPRLVLAPARLAADWGVLPMDPPGGQGR